MLTQVDERLLSKAVVVLGVSLQSVSLARPRLAIGENGAVEARDCKFNKVFGLRENFGLSSLLGKNVFEFKVMLSVLATRDRNNSTV